MNNRSIPVVEYAGIETTNNKDNFADKVVSIRSSLSLGTLNHRGMNE